MYRSHVLVCGGTGCTSSGSETLISLLQEELKKNGLENEVAIVKTGCHGLCAQGPVMVIYPDATFYSMVKPEDIPEIVSEHLLNPAEFWTRLPLPSVAANDPAFRNAPENNWSGLCEGLTFQRAILALERYGHHKLVTRLGKKLMQAVIDGGYVFTQQFDPFTGKPSRVCPDTKEPLPPDADGATQDAYGPTLLAVLEYIAHIWGVTMVRGQMWFSLGSGAPFTCGLTWGAHAYCIESDGQAARVLVDGVEKARSACGMRLITDQAGNVLDTVEIE